MLDFVMSASGADRGSTHSDFVVEPRARRYDPGRQSADLIRARDLSAPHASRIHDRTRTGCTSVLFASCRGRPPRMTKARELS